MGNEKVTPKAFNEAAWNMGLYLKWKDVNGDGNPDPSEVTPYAQTTTLYAKTNAQQLIRLVLEGASGQHLNVVRTPAYIEGLDKNVAALKTKLSVIKDEKVQGDVTENLRVALRDRDMAYRSWAKHTIDFSQLPEGEQKVAWIFVNEILPAVEAIHFSQNDPNNFYFFNEVATSGNLNDLLHTWYSAGPWCQEIHDELCNSDTSLPKRVPNAGTWPQDFTQKDMDKVIALPDTNPEKARLLGDFVTRSKNSEGHLEWLPLNANSQFTSYLEIISASLRKAAKIEGIDPALAKFFETRANEFQDRVNPFPFYNGDLAWIATKGGLDITLGFYERDGTAFDSTALMGGYVGPVDKEKVELGKRFQQITPLMEQGAVAYLGKSYTPRDFSKLPPLLFSNLIGAGDPRIAYVAGGYNLPNIKPYGDGGASKNVIILNNLASRLEDIEKPMGDVAIDPSQRNVSREDLNNFAVAHENAHGMGPLEETTKNLGPYKRSLEEAKADLEGAASFPTAVAKGLLTQEQADRAVISGLLFNPLRGLSYGMSDPHGIAAIIEFASLYKEGGILENANGFYEVNLKEGAIFKAAENVARRIEKLQMESSALGDKAAEEAAKWLAESRENLPSKMKYVYLPKLQQMPRDTFPWYSFKFSDGVAAQMENGEIVAKARKMGK